MSRVSKAAAAALGAGCLVVATPAADAAIVVSDTDEWTDNYVNTCDGPDGDVVIATEQVHRQTYTIKRREPGTNRFWFSATTRIAETNTNVETLRLLDGRTPSSTSTTPRWCRWSATCSPSTR